MPVYSTQRFGTYVLMTCVLGAVIGGLTVWSVDFLSPIPRVYCQMAGYGVEPKGSELGPGAPPRLFPLWSQINHTLEILDDNVIGSTLAVTAKKAPHNSTLKIVIRISFGKYAKLFPRLVDGTLSWSGNPSDVHVNETITIWSTLAFDDDGIYELHGTEISYYSSGLGSSRTNYYLIVEDGKIVKVTDHRPQTNEPQGTTYGGPEDVFNQTEWEAAFDEQHRGEPLSPNWGQINHTLRILGDNVVETILNMTAETEPPLPYVITWVAYGYLGGLIPGNLEGPLYWDGDLHENQTISLSAKLLLGNNGTYIIARIVRSYRLFYEMRYYVTVENNKITKVITQ